LSMTTLMEFPGTKQRYLADSAIQSPTNV